MSSEARAAPVTGAARPQPSPPSEVALTRGARARANLLGVPIALVALAICTLLGLLIRSAVFA